MAMKLNPEQDKPLSNACKSNLPAAIAPALDLF
jgi:hypothetical protein